MARRGWTAAAVALVGCGQTAIAVPSGTTEDTSTAPGHETTAAGASEDSTGTTAAASTSADASSDDGSGSTGGANELDPTAVCRPTADACDATPAQGAALFTAYRKDFYFDDTVYPEDTPPPLDGGRVHVAAVAQTTGTVTGVLVDGLDPESIYETDPASPPPFEWYHVWPTEAVEGQPIWVAFHSRDAAWDQAASRSLLVQTTNGPAVDGVFTPVESDVHLTYVTVADGGTSLLVHVHNDGPDAVELEGLLVDGMDVLSTGVACVPDATLGSAERALWSVPLCEPKRPGEAWTVAALFDDGSVAAGAGRVLPERFPIEAWTNTSECPFPSGNEENFANVRAAGIDTIYVHEGVCASDACDCDVVDLLGNELPSTSEAYAIATFGIVDPTAGYADLASTVGVAAVATGDESDGSIYDEDTGVPVAAIKARNSRTSWARYPDVPTFNGGMTNKNVGTFAGMTDIQGMDLYIAACAPHITMFTAHPPVRGAFDYLRNARNNHMPLPTWLYAQGLSPAWNEGDVHIQPDPQEILVQGMSAVAAGAKGLMWFQANQEEAQHDPARWAAIASINAIVGAVREDLRTADPLGSASPGPGLLVEPLRGRDVLLVPVIALETTAGPDDFACLLTPTERSVPHWIFADLLVEFDVPVPRDLGVSEVFEILADGTRDATHEIDPAQRTVRFSGIELGNEEPVRLFAIASEPGYREEVESRLGR